MRYGNYYSAAAADDMVDITSVSNRSSSGSRYAKSSGGNNGNKKKIILIVSIAAAAVAALAAAGICIFSFAQNTEETVDKEFTFAENTAISGIDISGKTVKEAKALLENNKKSFITPIKFSVNVADNSVELTQDNFEYTYNIDEVLEQVKADAESHTSDVKQEYSVKATVTDASVDKQVSAISEEYDTEPVNAYVTKFYPYAETRFEFADEIDGLKVDSGDLKAKMLSGFSGGQNYCTIDADVENTSAEVTVDFLQKNLVKLSSYETYSTNTANGTNNMKVSLAACNGSIIDPGEVWSFNECTGDSNLESNGYKSAHVISEGKIIDGIGGGICQSSSTIYNAAIRANMETVVRYNHKWASSYVPTGLDATIDYPGLDLKLKNVSGYQMFLECKVVDSTLYASFWGYQSPNYDEIKVANELGKHSGSSYSVRAWRIYYKDGKKVDEEELWSSEYDDDNGVIFYPADNDARDEKKDVDSLEDSSEETNNNNVSTVDNSSSQSNSSSSYEQQTEAAPVETEVPDESQAPDEPDTEAQEPQDVEP